MAKTEEIVWKKLRGDMFETFAVELKEFTQADVLPTSCDQDMKYCLELQKERLKEKGVIMKYEFVPRGHFAENSLMNKGWEDAHYKSRMEYRTCQWQRSFYREKKKLHSKKQNSILYQIITDTHNSSAVEEDDYTCPNCSAISKIRELKAGCPYCGTFFEMQDLFPKVTNYFMVKDQGYTENEIKGDIFKTIFPCILICIVVFSYFYSIQPETELIRAIITGVIAGIIGGGIFGYILWAILKIGSLFVQAGKSLPMLFSATGSAKHFENQMKRYSPEFSYEYFSAKVVSMLKMIIFAKDPQDVPIYEGKPLENMFAEILDSSYRGAVAFKKFDIQGNYCYVTVDAYMDNVYDGVRLRNKSEVFRVVMCKNIRIPIQCFFSIKKIHCKSCNCSFDATKKKICPSCNQPYKVWDDDWVIVDIEKR